MQNRLIGLITQVSDAADSIATASTCISQDSRAMSKRTTLQADSLQQTSQSMSGLGDRVKENADSSNRANQLAQDASEVAVTTISSVVGSIQKVAVLMGQINSASNDQRNGVSEVGAALGSVETGTQRNAVMAEESLAASEQLNAGAGTFASAVGQFKLGGRDKKLDQEAVS